MMLLFYVMKIKLVLFSKLMCCVYQITSFWLKCPVKRRYYSKRYAWKTLCSSKKSIFIYLLRKWCHTTQNIMPSLKKRNKVKVLDIRVLKEEKIFRRKYSVDTLTDIAAVNFGCASSASQSNR